MTKNSDLVAARSDVMTKETADESYSSVWDLLDKVLYEQRHKKLT
jgi:hypothetical protein